MRELATRGRGPARRGLRDRRRARRRRSSTAPCPASARTGPTARRARPRHQFPGDRGCPRARGRRGSAGAAAARRRSRRRHDVCRAHLRGMGAPAAGRGRRTDRRGDGGRRRVVGRSGHRNRARRRERGSHGGSPGYGVFQARDGEWIALGVLGEPRLWAAICRGARPGGARSAELRRTCSAPVRGGRRGGDRGRGAARSGRRPGPAVRRPVRRPRRCWRRRRRPCTHRSVPVPSTSRPRPGSSPASRLGSRAPTGLPATHVPEAGEHPEGFTSR